MDSVRALARSWQYQTLYSNGEKVGARIFVNSTNFSKMQIIFLQWLGIYSGLYEEMASGINQDFLTDAVLKDDIRTDAYLHWRKKENEKRRQEMDSHRDGHNKKHSFPVDKKKEFFYDFKTRPVRAPRSKR